LTLPTNVVFAHGYAKSTVLMQIRKTTQIHAVFVKDHYLAIPGPGAPLPVVALTDGIESERQTLPVKPHIPFSCDFFATSAELSPQKLQPTPSPRYPGHF
jgi:hypothetical protein